MKKLLFICSAMALFPLMAAETRIEFDNGVLNASADKFICLEKAVKFPAEGELEFEFKPEYGMEKKFPERKVFTYYLFDARTAKGGFFAGINVIPERNQTVIFLYGCNPGDNGKTFGISGNFTGKKNQWCKIKVRWRAKSLQLLVNDKQAVYINTAQFKNFSLELPETIQIGGSKRAPAAYGQIRNFVIREAKPAGKTSITAVPEIFSLEIRTENENLLHLVAESPGRTSAVTIRPAVFPIRKGNRYCVDFVNAVPYEVTAEKDGELTVTFPNRYRADMIISPVAGNNLIADGSFESSVWYGGTSAAIANTGKQSLQLTLDKFDSSVKAVSPEITLDPTKKYRFSVFYRQRGTKNDTMFGSYIYIYRDGKPAGRLAAADYEYNNFPKPVNAEDQWQYSKLNVRIPADWKNSRVTAKIIFSVSGQPGTVFFDDAKLQIAPPDVSPAGKIVPVKPVMDEKQLAEHFAKHPGYSAKIVRLNSYPAVAVNGKIIPQVPLCSWNSPLAATGNENGIEIILVSIPVNFWGVKKLSVWQEKDKFDFSFVDKALKDVLQYYPNAKIIVKVGGAYKNFGNELVHSKWIDRNGNVAQFRNTSEPGAAYSLISDEVRSACSDAYRRIAGHIARSPYGKSVIGCKFTFGSDGQWYPAVSPWNFKNFDYSEGSRLSVCNRIRIMYNNDLNALRKAWNDDTVTFENIRIPAAKEFEIIDRQLFSPNDPQHRRLMDCTYAYHREILKSIEIFCSAFKDGIGKDVITGTYYTSNSGMCHEELIRSDKVDFFAALGSYMRPRNLGGFSTAGVISGSIRLHNKLFFEEMDYRNDYSNGGDFNYRKYLGMPLDSSPANAFAQLRRSFGAVMTQGQTGWFMTMGQRCHFTWYGPYSPILKEVVNAYNLRNSTPVCNPVDTMVVFHEEKRPMYYTVANNYDHSTNYLSGFFPADSGIAVQHYYLSDLTNPDRHQSKLYIFSNTIRFTESQLQYIEKNLQKDGNILVFFNDAGALSNGGFEKTIRRLTGMNIQLKPEIMVSSMISGEKNCSLTRSLPVSPLYCGNTMNPLHFINDPSVTVIARYLNSNYAAGAIKKHSDWTAVYFGNFPNVAMTGDLIRQLATQAGLKPFAAAGDVSAAGNGIIMIHARSAGNKTIQWHGKCDLIDLTTNQTVTTNSSHFSFPMSPGETRWFLTSFPREKK